MNEGRYFGIYASETVKLGADILISDARGDTVVVDEKAQLHYINNPRQTFAFEVSYYSDEAESILDGWLVSSDNITNYYMLIWINSARNEQLNRIVAEDFNEITVAFVSKKRIIYYIEQLGYPVNRLRKIARDIRLNHYRNYFKLSEDAFIYYSKEGYEERPINVVIDWNVLKRLAYGVYRVNRKGCEKMKY